MPKPNAIDLFSGAGGLTVGLKQAGFKVVAAVEVYEPAARTYAANHRTTKLLKRDIRTVRGEELIAVGSQRNIHLIAGCPPCQGFSSLTSKYKRDDPRNLLVLEMARIIREISPSMVMMENVPGLADKGQAILDDFIAQLKSQNYKVTYDVVQIANYGVPQMRRRLVLLAGKGFEIPIPPATHSANPIKEGLKPWKVLKDAIQRRTYPVTLSFAKENGGPQNFKWHVIRNLTPLSFARLKALSEGSGRLSLPKHLRPACHKDSDQGFSNVYGRLSWSLPSPTITGGCTTPCKGRFGHPDEDRTISVREAALIQTFPEDYRFKTDFMEIVCDLIGNALPCYFAAQIAQACMKAYQQNSPKEVK
jgi:DNA (cytosine-5)-methyltransferase 1